MGKIKYYNKDKFTYYSKRYKKNITVEEGYPSDGATGAFDIDSKSWWVHDVLCDKKKFDDGTECTNWEASCILSDILWEEGRWLRSFGWKWSTYLWRKMEGHT